MLEERDRARLPSALLLASSSQQGGGGGEHDAAATSQLGRLSAAAAAANDDDDDSNGAIIRPQKQAGLFASMAKTIAKRWKELGEEQREKYNVLAQEDLVRYRRQMEEYNANTINSATQSGGRGGATHRTINNDNGTNYEGQQRLEQQVQVQAAARRLSSIAATVSSIAQQR